MRLVSTSCLAFAIALSSPAIYAQAQSETSRTVEGGGISIPGWKGMIDPNEKKQGQSLNGAKLEKSPDGMHVTTGPAVAYWNPSDTASGDYTVSATFKEPKYMNLNSHPHPYGLFIGGHDLGGADQSYLYCAAYGNGNFIVRGFGPEPFQVNGRRGEANAAVHKAAGKDEPVEQEISLSVKGDKVECSINGTVVGSYDKPAVTGAGKLKSTDGVYGIRFAHNTDVYVSDLKKK